MKKMIIFLLLTASVFLFGDSIEEIISQSNKLANAGKLEEAAEVLETAIKTNQNSADLYAQYGLYLSKLAGQASMMKAGMLSDKSFKQYDKALELEPNHVNATLYRGILSVNVPKFMGKLKQGIKDLELIQTRYGADQNLYMVSSYYLGKGYQKNKEFEKAASSFKFVIMYGKDTDFYEDSKTQYEMLMIETEADDEKVDNYKLGMEYLEANDLYKAVEHLRLAAQSRKDDLELHLVFARTIGQLAGQGYDETISEDVTIRAGLANEVFEVLSRCVELAPGNDEILFLRGSVALNLPFFVNSLETGIKDMEYLSQNGKTGEMKGQASYLLNSAKEMQLVYELAETGYQAETEEERQQLLSQFVQTSSPIEQTEPEGDFLLIEIALGYRDQIAPQTAVWIEDTKGNYLKTIYISGFAAFVKEHQKHLPRWAESSEFRDIEVVTGASIDCGMHLLYWDFTNYKDEKIEAKKFVVKTEICHWPHVQYTEQSLQIDLGTGNIFENSGDSYLISNLKVKHVER